MPRSRVAASHLRHFREHGIEARHARYARCEYVGSTGGVCNLCGNTNLLHLYRLTFNIPQEDRQMESAGIVETVPVAPRSVVFFPVGSECIITWATHLREAGHEVDAEAWERGPMETIRRIERVRSAEAAQQRRLTRIRAWLGGRTPEVAAYYEPSIERWAHHGETFVDRILAELEPVSRVAQGTPVRFVRHRMDWNPATGRRLNRHVRVWVCETCAGGRDGEAQELPAYRVNVRRCGLCNVNREGEGRNLMPRGPEQATIVENETTSTTRQPAELTYESFVGSLEHSSLPIVDHELIAATWRRAQEHTDSALHVPRVRAVAERSRESGILNWSDLTRIFEVHFQAAGTEVALNENEFLTWYGFFRPHIEAHHGTEQARIVSDLIRRALHNEGESNMLRSIAAQFLTRGELSSAQMRVVQDRAREQAVDPNTPECPVHHIPMRRRQGQHGEFWGCTQYPACHVTCNMTGHFRHVPEGVQAPYNPDLDAARRRSQQTTRAAGAQIVEPPPATVPWPEDSQDTRPGLRPDGRPIPARTGVQDDAANPDFSREFRRVLLATIAEKVQAGRGRSGSPR